MNKSDLIGELSRERGITLKQAEIVVNSMFEIMTESLAGGGRIEISKDLHQRLNGMDELEEEDLLLSVGIGS